MRFPMGAKLPAGKLGCLGANDGILFEKGISFSQDQKQWK